MGQSMLLGLLFMLLAKGTDDPIVTEEVLEEYDFIVVGAGASGAVVAARLSEIEDVTVLLLEAGPSDLTYPAIHLPHLADTLWGSPIDWGYQIVEQKYSLLQRGRTGKWPRGKVLGGTTAMNGMMWARGSPHDFDSWEDHGAKQWSWKKVEPYFRKVERVVDDDLSTNLGREGRINITRRYATVMAEAVIEAGREIGIPVGDYHDDEMEVIGNLPHNVYDGTRQSSVTAYLRPVLPERKDRFHVVTNAHVTKVLFHDEEKRKAIGVRYIKGGKTATVRCRKEVILSAGSIATPQLLMLSGIGPAEHLEKMGIDVILDAPGVGSNLQDHNAALAYYRVKNLKKDDIITDDMIKRHTMEYILNGTGPLTSGSGFDVVMHAKTKYAGTPVSLARSKRPFPEIQVSFFHKAFDIPYETDTNEEKDMNVIMIAVSLMHPKSKGTIRLHSKDPFQHPAVDPNYFSNDDDVKVMIEGFRILDDLESSKTLTDLGFEMVVPSYCNGSANAKTPRSDEFYRCVITALSFTAFHPCCSAKMGQRSDKLAVLDHRLRVRKISGLRVADASSMPHETSSNLQAPCYVVGEKAADMIKEDWNLKQ